MKRKRRTTPWTFWATGAYAIALTVFSLGFWIADIPPIKNTWFNFALWAPFVLLWWLDTIKRADAETAYQEHVLRDEVRRAVKAELAGEKRSLPKTVDAVFETTEDVVVPAGTAVTAELERRR